MFNLVGHLGSPDMAEYIRKKDYFLTGGTSQPPGRKRNAQTAEYS